MHPNSAKNKDHLPGLDGLRGFLSIFVVLAHTAHQHLLPEIHWIWSIGNFNLLLFFSLSGFLMSYHYLPGKDEPTYWLSFLLRRFFRVYPTFMLVSLIVLCMHYQRYAMNLDGEGLSYLGKYTPYTIFKQLQLGHGMGYFWSVTAELKFYLLFCLWSIVFYVLLPLHRFVFPALVLAFLLLAAADMLGARFLLLSTRGPTMVFFLGGILVEQVMRRFPAARRVPDLLSDLAFIIGMAVVLVMSVKIDSQNQWYHWENALLASILLFCVAQGHGLITWFLTLRAFKWLGEVSFSLYLTHSLVFLACRNYLPLPPEKIYMAALPLAVLTAGICYTLVENPSNQLGKILARKLRGKKPPKASQEQPCLQSA